jgi:hypothetical protein
MPWQNLNSLEPKQFTCGHCYHLVATRNGYFHKKHQFFRIYICPGCEKPTFFEGGVPIPGVAPGNDVGNLPEDLAKLYGEARRCCSVSAFTSSVLSCRKMLMNIAVQKGAAEGQSFAEYVNYLEANNYTPPGGKEWVDHIRKKGNEATHEIALMSKDDAEELLGFAEMLLKFIYEFPARIKPPTP